MRPVSKSSIGVLIADDSAAFCRLIATLLQSESSTHIVGIAGNLDDALHFAVEYTPDVLLLDLHLDDLAGHDSLSVKIGFLSCMRNIIAMSTRTDEEERQFAQLYGASHLIDKFFLSEQLIPTIRSCGQRKRPLSLTPTRRQRQAPSRWAS
ncbi:MAG TPA: response regulator [Candidatus Acidoferrum sp.]|nr:response regulator [Candidatus Acidoferrum sp.]